MPITDFGLGGLINLIVFVFLKKENKGKKKTGIMVYFEQISVWKGKELGNCLVQVSRIKMKKEDKEIK